MFSPPINSSCHFFMIVANSSLGIQKNINHLFTIYLNIPCPLTIVQLIRGQKPMQISNYQVFVSVHCQQYVPLLIDFNFELSRSISGKTPNQPVICVVKEPCNFDCVSTELSKSASRKKFSFEDSCNYSIFVGQKLPIIPCPKEK